MTDRQHDDAMPRSLAASGDDLDAHDLEGVEDPGEDMELIVAFLQARLDPERVALVEQRLEDDADFRHMAEPLMWAWGMRAPGAMQPPVTREELAMRWDEFTKRAGFIHQRRKTRKRRLTILGIVLGVLLTGGWIGREPLGTWYRDWRDYTVVEQVNAWVPIGEDAEARVAPGSTLRVRRVPADSGDDIVKLAGVAEFRVQRPRIGRLGTQMRTVRVRTAAGDVTTLRGWFTVTARGDTTTVALHPPEAPEGFGRIILPTSVSVTDPRGRFAMLGEGETGRVVAGTPPEIVP